MTVQQLIDKLNLVENKNLPCIVPYDGSYNTIKDLKEVLLWSDDEEGTNVDFWPWEDSIDYPAVLLAYWEDQINIIRDNKNV